MTARRVLWITRAANRRGGIPRAVYETIRLLGADFNVTLAAADCEPSPEARLSRLPIPPGLWGRRWGGFFGESLSFLRHVASLPRGGFDVTVAVLGDAWTSDVAAAHFCYPAWRDAVLPVTPAGLPRLARRLNPAGFLQWAVEARQAARAQRVVAVSEGLRSDLIRRYGLPPGKVLVIPNGVDAETFTPAGRVEARAELARAHAAPASSIWLLFVAAYDLAWKGLAPVLEALTRPLPRAPILWIAGGWDPEGRFRRLAGRLGVADRVRWLGGRDDMPRIYRACDVYLQPSAWEAFSLASLEAAASGLPIVATRVSGMSEILQEGVNGHFVARDGAEIADRVARLADDEGLRVRMGEASREAARRFSWRACARLWKEMLESLA